MITNNSVANIIKSIHPANELFPTYLFTQREFNIIDGEEVTLRNFNYESSYIDCKQVTDVALDRFHKGKGVLKNQFEDDRNHVILKWKDSQSTLLIEWNYTDESQNYYVMMTHTKEQRIFISVMESNREAIRRFVTSTLYKWVYSARVHAAGGNYSFTKNELLALEFFGFSSEGFNV